MGYIAMLKVFAVAFAVSLFAGVTQHVLANEPSHCAAMSTSKFAGHSSSWFEEEVVAPSPERTEGEALSTCSFVCEIRPYHSTTNRNEVLWFTSFCQGLYCTGQPSYEWNFGDGTPVETEATVSHIFSRAGVYTVSLRVEWDGAVSTDSTQIKVVTPPIIQSIRALRNPFRIVFIGEDFLPGLTVTFLSDGMKWSLVKRKSNAKVVLNGGKDLKQRFPLGVPVWIRVENVDGGMTVLYFQRG